MRGVTGKAVFGLALLGMLCLARPASAQTTVGFPEGVTFQFVKDFICTCSFKCPIGPTLWQLVDYAERTSGATRDSALRMAVECCARLSRDIDPKTGKPYYSLAFFNPNWQDLAAFWHDPLSQALGRALCAAIECLRIGDPGPCFIVLP